MAFASIGTLGSVNSKTANQTQLVLTTTAAASAGRLVVVIVAVDNSAYAAGGNDNNGITGVVDSAGNTYTGFAVSNYGSGVAAQSLGVVGMFYSVLTNALASGGTITASFGATIADRDASAATAWQFSIGSSSVAEEGRQTITAGLFPSMDVTTANIECLRIRGTSSEDNIGTTNWTPTSGWTAFSANGTTGGSATTNQAVRGEFHISTGTNDASNPSSVGEHSNIYLALKESGSLSLIADRGAFSEAGQAAKLTQVLSSVQGSFALTGVAAQIAMGAPVGSFSLGGQAAKFNFVTSVFAPGAFALGGQNALLTNGVVGALGSFALSGKDAKLTQLLGAGMGSFALTGQSVVDPGGGGVAVRSGFFLSM